MKKVFLSLGVMAMLLMLPMQASAVVELLGGDIRIDGFIRAQTQFFTQEDAHDEVWADFRGTLQIESQIRFSQESLMVAIFRGVRHGLGEEAEEAFDAQGISQDFYDEDEIREIYLEIVKPGWYMRAGRQQIIWGQTDFFRLADIINPIDFSWRAFFEDWQDIRIPNYMILLSHQVCDYGTMEWVWRPGIDDEGDVVDKFAPAGAPWGVRPSPPVPFNVALDASETPGRGLDEGSFGARWLGDFSAFGVFMNYSLSYFYGWQEAPAAEFLGFDAVTNTALLNLAYPRNNVFGATLTFPVQAAESIVRLETNFTRDRLFNFNSATADPGFAAAHPKGTVKKDIIRYAIGWDWVPHYSWTKWWSRQAWMYSIQLFQTYVLDWDTDEDILLLGGYAPRRNELETVITAYMAGHYDMDRIQPMFAIGYDDDNEWMYLAKVTFAYGDHWRTVVEWDAFDAAGRQKFAADMGILSDQDVLSLKVTYAF